MTPKEALKELYKCDNLNCAGCSMNIKVLHGFDCAARFCSLDSWEKRLLHVCRINSYHPAEAAIGEVIFQHKYNKDNCVKCPFWDDKYGKCKVIQFQKRQTIIRVMNNNEIAR